MFKKVILAVRAIGLWNIACICWLGLTVLVFTGLAPWLNPTSSPDIVFASHMHIGGLIALCIPGDS